MSACRYGSWICTAIFGCIGFSAQGEEPAKPTTIPGLAPVRVLTGHEGSVYRVAVSGDGRLAISAGQDGTARLWDLEKGTRTLSFLHAEQVHSVALSDDGTRALTGTGERGPSSDNSIRLWNLTAGTILRRLSGHTHVAHYVAFLPGGRRAVSAGLDFTVRVWDLETGTEVQKFGDWQEANEPDPGRLANRQVWSGALSPDQQHVLLGCRNGIAYCCKLDTGEVKYRLEGQRLKGHQSCFSSIAISSDGQRAVASSYGNDGADVAIYLWSLADGTLVRRIAGPGNIWSLAFLPGTSYVLAGRADGDILIWDVEHDAILGRIEGHLGPVRHIVVSQDGRTVVSCCDDGTLRTWKVVQAQAPAVAGNAPAPRIAGDQAANPPAQNAPPGQPVVEPGSFRMPLPNPADLDAALSQLKEIFNDDYAKLNRPQEKTAPGKKTDAAC